MPWYYADQGKPVGPVDDATLQQRASGGQLAPDSLVWNPDVSPEWVAARTVPLLAAAFAGATPDEQPFARPTPPPPPYAAAAPAPAAPPPSGPDPLNSELTRRARESLSGAWGPAIGLIVIAYAILFGAMLVSMAVPFANLVVQYVLMPPMMVGVVMFFLSRIRRQPATIGQLFQGFNAFGPSVLTMLLLVLIFLGVMLALAIPFMGAAFAILASGGGFAALRESGGSPETMRSLPVLMGVFVIFYIALLVVMTWLQLRFAMIWAILADRPATGAVATLRRSAQIMRGRKWKFFCLMLRYVGWSLLSILTCGIGYLWVLPYMCAGYVAFYDDAAARTPEA